MPSVNNIESLRQWLFTCPALDPDSPIHVDYFGGNPVEYALFSVPSAIKYHDNVLGERVPDAVQTVDYIFGSIENYGPDRAQNAANLGVYQDVVNWIMEQNAAFSFPSINEGVITGITPSLTGYPMEATANTARYQINLKITYRRQ